MLNATRKFIEEIKEFKKGFNSYVMGELDYLDEDAIAMYIKSMKILDTSMEMLEKQAELLNGMNEKLDKLLLMQNTL